MKVRRNGFAPAAVVPTLVAAALVVALVAVLGSAQAAPSTKVYDATVRVKRDTTPGVGSAVLTLTLTNSARSKQTLGSANFTAPQGVAPSPPVLNPHRTGWQAGLASGGVVTFRSTSNALKPGESVSADVPVTITASCSNATWSTQAKQSNDFSGAGNEFSSGSSTNLRPLGSLAIADIGTEVDDPETPAVEAVFVPQIVVSEEAPVSVTANDICGEPYVNYGVSTTFGASAALAVKDATPPRLEDAVLTAITWQSGSGAAAGTGSATVEPVVVETGDQLVVSDQFTTLSAASDEFDVVETICTSFDDTCHWQDKQGNPGILADAAAPPAGASLGIGFNSDLANFTCNSGTDPVGDTFININPRDYPAAATVTIALTYKKSVTGNGPASSFDLCLSKDNGLSWDFESPVPACSSTTPAAAEAPCTIEKKRTTGGDLSVILFIEAEDPWGGLS